MKDKGWIKLYRSLQDSWLWKEKPFTQGQAWIDLIMMANYEDAKIPYKGEIIVCEKGTVNRSISSLAARWGWSRDKVRRFIDLLESDGMVATKITTHRTTISLVNYGFFQNECATNNTTDKAASRQQVDTKKKEKKEKNNILSISQKVKKNSFNDFDQRGYDIGSIEAMLEGRQG